MSISLLNNAGAPTNSTDSILAHSYIKSTITQKDDNSNMAKMKIHLVLYKKLARSNFQNLEQMLIINKGP